MSGIVGLATPIPYWDRLVEARLTHALHSRRHRRADDSRPHRDDYLYARFRRLAIVDADGGAQPLNLKGERLVGACNGEILNHILLRDELTGTGTTCGSMPAHHLRLMFFHVLVDEWLAQVKGGSVECGAC